MFKLHFGDGYTTCPNAGSNAPSLAGGLMDELLEDVWAQQESKSMSIELYEGAPVIQPGEWGIIVEDFHRAKAS